MPRIRFSYSLKGREQTVEFDGMSIVIGRAEKGVTCDFDLAPDARVSRRHARVFLQQEQYWVEDLSSRHGTKLNGREIKANGPFRLKEGDSLLVGVTQLRAIEAQPQLGEETVHPGREAGARVETEATGSGREPAAKDSSGIRIGATLKAGDKAEFPAGKGLTETRRRVDLLCELADLAATENDLERFSRMLLDRCLTVLPPATRGSLLLAVATGGELALHAHVPVGRPAVSLTLAKQALDLREGFLWERGVEDPTPSVARHGMGTGIYAPLIFGTEALGVLAVDHAGPDRVFAADDLSLLMAVAKHCALFVAHHQTQAALRRQTEFGRRLFSSRFAPQLREKLFAEAANGALTTGTRRSAVTILCADIRGFAQLTAELGPQRTGDVLSAYFPPLIEAIFAHRGTIERFVGDSIFAVFGSPEADPEQHPNALGAALAMQAALILVSETRRAAGLAACSMGIGISTGDAVHGFIGNAERLEFAVVGEPANQAARHCTAAAAGEVIVSEGIHARMFNRFEFVPVQITPKHEASRTAYRLTGPLPPARSSRS